MSIPKYIHQICLFSKLPEKYNTNVASVKNNSNGWVYRCWNESDIYNLCLFIDQECANVFKNYKSLSDKIILAKYVILYNLGGIFIDLDCQVLKPLNSIPQLNNKDLILSYAPNDYIKNLIIEGSFFKKLLNTSTILSSQRNIYILKMINNIIKKRHNDKYLYHESLLLTNTIIPYKNDKKILLLDHRYFDSCHSIDSCCVVSKKAIINHKHELSLLNKRTTKFLGCVLHLKEDYDYIVYFMTFIVFIVFLITKA